MRGGRQWHGWTKTHALLADIYDALNQNTAATGSWKKGKVPKFQPWPRPKSKARRPTRVADIRKHFGRG